MKYQQDYHQDKLTSWDARQHFTKYLIDLARTVGECKIGDIKAWVESVTDFFDIACSPLIQISYEQYAVYLEWISEQDNQTKKKHLREIFRELNRELFQRGIYMPILKKVKSGEEILEF